MFNDVILLHRAGSSGFGFANQTEFAGQWLHFNTCMRKIAIGDVENLASIRSFLKSDDELYRGEEAFRFLLQVICGLHSPLVGETEVYGQFKNAVTAFEIPATPWGGQLQRMIRALFEDAKRIRQTHLVDLGSQSYGSVLRRELRGTKRVHVLGAGHLVQEVLPWLCKDGTEVHVHCRNPQKAALELAAFSQIQLHDLKDQVGLVEGEALVVAAPVSAEWLQEWVPAAAKAHGKLRLIADLRGDSDEDPITGYPAVLNLRELFARIESNQAHIMARKRAALAAIEDAVEERNRYVEYRPFGWEDVCA